MPKTITSCRDTWKSCWVVSQDLVVYEADYITDITLPGWYVAADTPGGDISALQTGTAH